jgi:hypothetical protein
VGNVVVFVVGGEYVEGGEEDGDEEEGYDCVFL